MDRGEVRDDGGDPRALRRRLRALVRKAQDNEARLRRFQRQELHLMEAATLPELMERLLEGTCRSFGLEAAALVLVDPSGTLRELLAGALGGADPACLHLVGSAQALSPLLGRGDGPSRLGPYDADRHGPWLAGLPVASVAAVPLRHGGGPVGALLLGSRDPDRYRPSHATEFLDHFGAVVAVCLESAFNRERLRRASITDPLTGVPNRRYFEQRLREELERARRAGTPLGCAFIDIDRFKAINDGHGHEVGDHVLRAVARVVDAGLRACDVLARYGGEEFVALLPGSGLEEALAIAERVRAAVAASPVRPCAGTAVPVTVSVGVSALARVPPGDVAAAGEALTRAADRGLYAAKAAGRNRVVAGPAVD
ncbi:GGDEF domain-containing protein [Inmirania thermothiophila]|uniref:diguanylate cyclase n=1 Tax=Inmirania thermothiophila TaxID=1750597 RepID=A0A3N1Y836_9GAMM|nr:DUF484 family protein [Inmirania thermothiophila]ROR34983.1 diguanylate cyclase (GGDEF)-like protein [Inmirania thermothiophila]